MKSIKYAALHLYKSNALYEYLEQETFTINGV